MSTNDITGDPIKTKPASEAFRSNWDNIDWGKKDDPQGCPDLEWTEQEIADFKAALSKMFGWENK